MRASAIKRRVLLLTLCVSVLVLLSCCSNAQPQENKQGQNFGADAEKGQTDLILLIPHFSGIPQWSSNEWEQEEREEKCIVYFQSDSGSTYFHVKEGDDEFVIPVDDMYLFGDYYVSENYILLFGQAGWPQNGKMSTFYYYEKSSGLTQKVALETDCFFWEASGIAADEVNSSFFVMTNIYPEETEQYTLLEINCKDENPFVAELGKYAEPTVISGCRENALILQTEYDEEKQLYTKSIEVSTERNGSEISGTKVDTMQSEDHDAASDYTNLSWITENGAVGFFNSLYTPEKQTTDILAYYDFESLTFKLFELPEMIRGRTSLHKLYLLDNLVIGFSARVEEQGGNNHIIDDSIDSHFVIWNTTNNNLKDVRLDPDYYLYAHKLMISANVDNAFYVLGCYKQERDVLLLKINTDDGSIEKLGVYEEKRNSFNTGKQGVFIGYEDGYTYYKFVEQTGDDIKLSLIRVDGTNEECIIEDMFPGNISSPAENMYFLSDGILYYYGIDRDKIEGYVFEANLHTGELQYRIATEEEGSRKGVSRHGEYLIFGPPINPSGILSEDSLLAIKAEDYIENPVFIRFAPIS